MARYYARPKILYLAEFSILHQDVDFLHWAIDVQQYLDTTNLHM